MQSSVRFEKIQRSPTQKPGDSVTLRRRDAKRERTTFRKSARRVANMLKGRI